MKLVIKDSILATIEDGDVLKILWDGENIPYVVSKYDEEDRYTIHTLLYYHVKFEVIK